MTAPAFDRIADTLARASDDRRNSRYLAYWIAWPFTLVECMVLALILSVNYAFWRLVFAGRGAAAGKAPLAGGVARPAIDAENALGVMRTLEDIAAASGARLYWISGTLLGLERMGQPLPHDNDMDAGIDLDDPHFADFIRALWESEHVVRIAPQYISLKTRIQNPDLHAVPGGIIRFKSDVRNASAPGKPPVKTDIFVHYRYCGGSMHGSRNTLWWNSPFTVARRPYGQQVFSVPDNAPLHLTENYGDYRKEVREFENCIDCPNAMHIFSWTSLGYLLVRQRLMLKRGRVDRARRIGARMRATLLKGIIPLSAERHRPHLGS